LPDIPARVLEALREIHDPCCRDRGLSLVDMGLVRSIECDTGDVRVELMLTSGWCPFAANILTTAEATLKAISGVRSATVAITFDEAWTMDRLSAKARRALVFLPEPGRVADRDAYLAEQSKEGG
jgi:metal-sulfur cluster biosynthetic enzyme